MAFSQHFWDKTFIKDSKNTTSTLQTSTALFSVFQTPERPVLRLILKAFDSLQIPDRETHQWNQCSRWRLWGWCRRPWCRAHRRPLWPPNVGIFPKKTWQRHHRFEQAKSHWKKNFLIANKRQISFRIWDNVSKCKWRKQPQLVSKICLSKV